MGLDVKRPGLKSMWTMTSFGLKYRVRIWKTQQHPPPTPPPPKFKLFIFVFNIIIFSFVWFFFVVGGGVFVCFFF